MPPALLLRRLRRPINTRNHGFGFPKWVLAGSIGGLVGAAIWAAISYAVNAEVGYVAWGIGGIVGIAVRFVAGEREEGIGPGVTAAVIAILAVLGGKYAAVHMLVSHHMGNVEASAGRNHDRRPGR